MRQQTIDKAARIVASGQVFRLPAIGGGVKMWKVAGSTQDYLVVTRDGKARCSCMAGQKGVQCSHALAALHNAK